MKLKNKTSYLPQHRQGDDSKIAKKDKNPNSSSLFISGSNHPLTQPLWYLTLALMPGTGTPLEGARDC